MERDWLDAHTADMYCEELVEWSEKREKELLEQPEEEPIRFIDGYR